MADDIDIGVNVHEVGEGARAVSRAVQILETQLSTLTAITQGWKETGAEAKDIATALAGALQSEGKMAGATAAQLAQLAAAQAIIAGSANQAAVAVRRVGQAAIASNAALNQNTTAFATNATGARRGANAIATIAFAMEGGTGSAKAMATAFGSATQSIASLGTSASYAALGGLGAVVTILAVVIESLYKMSAEGKRAKDTLGEIGNLNANQLGILAKTEQSNYEQAVENFAAAQRIRDAAVNRGNLIESAAAIAAFEIEQKHYESRLEEHQKFSKQFIEQQAAFARELAPETRKAQDAADIAVTGVRGGPAAAARLSLERETREYADSLTRRGVIGKAFDDLMTARARENGAKLQEINRTENEQIQASQLAFANERLTAEAKLNDDVFQVQINAADRARVAGLKRITDDRNLQNEKNKDERNRQIADVEATHTAALVNVEKNRSEQLLLVREELQGKLDELADRGVDEAKIRARYKREIDAAKATIDSDSDLITPADRANAQATITNAAVLAQKEIAKARLDQTIKNDNLVFSAQEEGIKRIQALKAAGEISDEDARQRTIAALTVQFNAARDSLTELRAIAALLPGNAQAQADVETYTTKVLELGIAISEISDRFRDLKEAGISATQSAIQTLILSIPKVLVQSQATAAIDQMRVHIASANAQLADLLKGPQTPAVTAQIVALRAEIQNVNIELRNAKSELVTWKSLFLDAARSIVSALAEVSSKMLATLLIQDLLHGFGGGGGGSAAASFVGDVVGAGVFAAEGGMIRGPGTGTSDSIPARLSHGEYVVNARATARVGQSFLDSVNALGAMPRMSRPSRIARYAEGGIVSASSNDATSSLHATVGLESGLVLRHLESSEGEGVILKVLSRHQNKLRAMLGGR